jgi:hypothetical protein
LSFNPGWEFKHSQPTALLWGGVLGFPFLFSKKESKMNARTNSPRSNANANDYFNLHVSGLGYLSRVRWVETKSGGRKAQPFLACTIGALRGSSDDVQYTYFDVRVSGQEAIDLVDKLGHDVDENRKVIIAFKASDIYVNVYEREMKDKSGRKTGHVEAAANIKVVCCKSTWPKLMVWRCIAGHLVPNRSKMKVVTNPNIKTKALALEVRIMSLHRYQKYLRGLTSPAIPGTAKRVRTRSRICVPVVKWQPAIDMKSKKTTAFLAVVFLLV